MNQTDSSSTTKVAASCILQTLQDDRSVAQCFEEFANIANLTGRFWLQPYPQRDRIKTKTFGELPIEDKGESLKLEEAALWGAGWQLSFYRGRRSTQTRISYWRDTEFEDLVSPVIKGISPGDDDVISSNAELTMTKTQLYLHGQKKTNKVNLYQDQQTTKWFCFA